MTGQTLCNSRGGGQGAVATIQEGGGVTVPKLHHVLLGSIIFATVSPFHLEVMELGTTPRETTRPIPSRSWTVVGMAMSGRSGLMPGLAMSGRSGLMPGHEWPEWPGLAMSGRSGLMPGVGVGVTSGFAGGCEEFEESCAAPRGLRFPLPTPLLLQLPPLWTALHYCQLSKGTGEADYSLLTCTETESQCS